VPTRSTVTPRRWKKRRIALRDCGTASAAATATIAASTRAVTSRRRLGRSSSPDATSGVSGHSMPSARRSRSSSVIALPETIEGARDTGLDRAAAHAECGRGLGLVELEQVTAGEREARVVRQRVEGLEEPRPLLRRGEGRHGGRGGAPRDVSALQPEHQRGAAAHRAAAVPRLVRDDAQQPGPERRVGPEAAERAPGLEHALLDGILGLAPRDEVGDSEGGFLMHAHELFEGALVPTPGAAHEVALLEWTALHRPHYTARYVAVPRMRGECDAEYTSLRRSLPPRSGNTSTPSHSIRRPSSPTACAVHSQTANSSAG